ncbi:hypothetical protein B0H17DRAFT_933462, partial [Mycena rosella]
KKCVFLGYPQEYPEWLFWHPQTKKTIISDRADFDEQYFPGNTFKILDTMPLPQPVPSVYTPADDDDTSDQGEEQHVGDPSTHLDDPPSPTPRPQSPFASSSPLSSPPSTPQSQRTKCCLYQRRTEAKCLKDEHTTIPTHQRKSPTARVV